MSCPCFSVLSQNWNHSSLDLDFVAYISHLTWIKFVSLLLVKCCKLYKIFGQELLMVFMHTLFPRFLLTSMLKSSSCFMALVPNLLPGFMQYRGNSVRNQSWTPQSTIHYLLIFPGMIKPSMILRMRFLEQNELSFLSWFYCAEVLHYCGSKISAMAIKFTSWWSMWMKHC